MITVQGFLFGKFNGRRNIHLSKRCVGISENTLALGVDGILAGYQNPVLKPTQTRSVADMRKIGHSCFNKTDGAEREAI